MQLRSYVLYAGSSLWISPSKCLGLEPKWHCHFGIPRQHRRLHHVSTLMVGRFGDLWEWTVLNHQQFLVQGAPKSWHLQHFQQGIPRILAFAALSVQGIPRILAFAALSVQGGPQILAFAALSVQGGPQILAFAAFAEFPVFGSEKLNRWSAPRTRSERDADLHILAPTQGKTGIALKVLPKQAFKFKDMKAPDSSSLPHLQCNQAPKSFEILEFYSIFSAMTSPNAGICSTFSARNTPNPGICSTLSAMRPPNPGIFAALSVQGGPQILAFAALSVQGGPQILAFAAFAEFPVFGSEKLNRWSAPRTRSERDADLHILAPTQGKTPKQAFKFKDMKAPDSSSLPHLQCNQAPKSFEILEFYSIFSAMTSPNAGICSTFSAMRRPNPGICSTLSEFLQCLTATRPPHRALTVFSEAPTSCIDS